MKTDKNTRANGRVIRWSAWLGISSKILDALSDFCFFFRHRKNVSTVKTGLKGIGLTVSVCFLFCGLMLCECVGNQMAEAGQQQTEQRQIRTIPAASIGDAKHNPTKSNDNSTPDQSVLQRVKAHLRKKVPLWLNVLIHGLAFTSATWAVCRSVREWRESRCLTKKLSDRPENENAENPR